MFLTWLLSTTGWSTGWMPRGPISWPKTSRISSSSGWHWPFVWWVSIKQWQHNVEDPVGLQNHSVFPADQTSSGRKASTWSAAWHGWPHVKLRWKEGGKMLYCTGKTLVKATQWKWEYMKTSTNCRLQVTVPFQELSSTTTMLSVH